MGNWFSWNPSTSVDSDGQVNNNVIVENGPAGYDTEMLILTAIICGIKIFEFVVLIYKRHSRYITERHTRKLQQGKDTSRV